MVKHTLITRRQDPLPYYRWAPTYIQSRIQVESVFETGLHPLGSVKVKAVVPASYKIFVTNERTKNSARSISGTESQEIRNHDEQRTQARIDGNEDRMRDPVYLSRLSNRKYHHKPVPEGPLQAVTGCNVQTMQGTGDGAYPDPGLQAGIILPVIHTPLYRVAKKTLIGRFFYASA